MSRYFTFTHPALTFAPLRVYFDADADDGYRAPLHALLSEIRQSIRVNKRLLSESASRVAQAAAD